MNHPTYSPFTFTRRLGSQEITGGADTLDEAVRLARGNRGVFGGDTIVVRGLRGETVYSASIPVGGSLDTAWVVG